MSQTDPRRRIPRTDALLALPALAQAAARGTARPLVQGRDHGRAGAGPRRRDRPRGRRRRGRGRPADPGHDAAPGAQRHRRRRAHQPRPGAPVPGGRRGADRRRGLRRRGVRRRDRGPGQARARRRWPPCSRPCPTPGGALVVNNGAAALVLATTALAAGREVVVSRGEMVEIGDGFRLPDLIASTGARLREVGTTNRTTPARTTPTRSAPRPAASSRSTRATSGSRASPRRSGLQELATLGVPVVMDIGSGLLRPAPAAARRARRHHLAAARAPRW